MSNIEKRMLKLPLSEADIRSLQAGDIVSLTGTLTTARDAAHQRFYEAIQRGQEPPVDFSRVSIYYAGPSPALNGAAVGSCGPTTSARMDDYTPLLIEQGLRVMIGKGKRSESVRNTIAAHGAIYLTAIGGAGALYQSKVTACRLTAYPDLGCEAVYELDVQNFETVVAIDSVGNTILK